mgnify:CR=1 FL=1
MELEEETAWKRRLPEVWDWLPKGMKKRDAERGDLLSAAEARVAAFDSDIAQRLVESLAAYSYHRLPDTDLELIVRLFLGLKAGRHNNLPLGDAGRRLLRTAERRAAISSTHVESLRTLVHAELEG